MSDYLYALSEDSFDDLEFDENFEEEGDEF